MGTLRPRNPGRQLDPAGNGGTRGMVIQGVSAPGQNPAYRSSARIFPVFASPGTLSQ